MNWRSAPTIQWSSYSPKLEVSYGGSELRGVARVHIVQVQCPHLTALWCNYNQLGIWKLHLWNLQCFKSKCVPNGKFINIPSSWNIRNFQSASFFSLEDNNWNSVVQFRGGVKLEFVRNSFDSIRKFAIRLIRKGCCYFTNTNIKLPPKLTPASVEWYLLLLDY